MKVRLYSSLSPAGPPRSVAARRLMMTMMMMISSLLIKFYVEVEGDPWVRTYFKVEDPDGNTWDLTGAIELHRPIRQ